jgi:diaminopimelate epimerase
MTAFLKMHGLGNDFAVFDARKQGLVLDTATAKAVADRRFGIGCDQVIVIEKSPRADAFMRVFNADGGLVESCGNATRCVARLLMDEKGKSEIRLDTLGGLLVCTDAEDGAVTVDMGEPGLAWDQVPLARPADTNTFSLNVDGVEHIVAAVSTGNPHCVIFVEDAERAPVERIGARIEHHPMFPHRTNVEFVTPLSRDRLRMRVWERGVGVTIACGTGACASAVAAHRRGLTDRKVEVVLDGGVLGIEWRESDGHVLMTGPSTLAFKGEIDLTALT